MALWTVLILSAFLIAALTNMDDPTTALNIGIPEEVWALLGISHAGYLANKAVGQLPA